LIQLTNGLENLAQLEEEIAALVGSDEAVAGLCTVSEFGLKAVEGS
jgi:hypothetical protein